MAKQERVKYEPPKERSQQHDYEAKDAKDEQEQARRAQAAQEAGKVAVEHTDDLLDEIDSILEVNAEQFIRAYVQKGGQ